MVDYDNSTVNKLEDLSDLEVAVLLCLVAKEHCLIDAEPQAIDQLVDELTTVAFSPFLFYLAFIQAN